MHSVSKLKWLSVSVVLCTGHLYTADVLTAVATSVKSVVTGCFFADRSLNSVPTAAAERFMKMAEEVAASHGAVESLAAAIAVISGNDKPRSLLTATPVRLP